MLSGTSSGRRTQPGCIVENFISSFNPIVQPDTDVPRLGLQRRRDGQQVVGDQLSSQVSLLIQILDAALSGTSRLGPSVTTITCKAYLARVLTCRPTPMILYNKIIYLKLEPTFDILILT